MCEVLVQIIYHLLLMLQSKNGHSQRAVTMNQFFRYMYKVRVLAKNICPSDNIFSALVQFWLVLYRKSPFGQRICKTLKNLIFKGLRLTYQEKKPRPNHTLILSFNKYMLIECFWSMTLNKGQGLVHVPR